MAVPKKRTTSASRDQRRAHDSLKAVSLVIEKSTNTAVPRRLHKAAALGLIRTKKTS